MGCSGSCQALPDKKLYPNPSRELPQSKSAGRDDALICKFDNNVLVRIQGKFSVVVHGKALLN